MFGWLACMAKTLTLDVTHKLLDQFVHTCHPYRHHWLLPFYTTFTDLAWRSEGQCKAKPIGLIFLQVFHLIGMKCDVLMKQFQPKILRLILVRFCETRGISAVLPSVSFYHWHAFKCLIQPWYGDRYYCTVHFDSSLIDLGFDSRSRECEKANTSVQIIS